MCVCVLGGGGGVGVHYYRLNIKKEKKEDERVIQTRCKNINNYNSNIPGYKAVLAPCEA